MGISLTGKPGRSNKLNHSIGNSPFFRLDPANCLVWPLPDHTGEDDVQFEIENCLNTVFQFTSPKQKIKFLKWDSKIELSGKTKTMLEIMCQPMNIGQFTFKLFDDHQNLLLEGLVQV